MREFLRDNPRFKFSIIITIAAIAPMLYLAVVGIIRGKYLATAICVTAAAIIEASDIIMIGRKYKQYKRDKSREATVAAVNKYLDDLIDKSKNNNNNKEKDNETVDEYKGLKVPKLSEFQLAELWYEVKDNRYCACRKDSSFCGNLNCIKCLWAHTNAAERYNYLKSIFEKEEGDKETMEENKTIEEFLRPGVLFKTESGKWFINIRGNFAYNVMTPVDAGYIKLWSASTVDPKAIVEAYDIDETIAGVAQPLFISTIEAIIKGLYLPSCSKTWKRSDPVKEMTMADLEKHFGCKVKIVKED